MPATVVVHTIVEVVRSLGSNSVLFIRPRGKGRQEISVSSLTVPIINVPSLSLFHISYILAPHFSAKYTCNRYAVMRLPLQCSVKKIPQLFFAGENMSGSPVSLSFLS